MGKLDLEERMTVKHLKARGLSQSGLARLLGVSEGAVRYHVGRQRAGLVDGRSQQVHLACGWAEPIANWLEASVATKEPLNLAALQTTWWKSMSIPGA